MKLFAKKISYICILLILFLLLNGLQGQNTEYVPGELLIDLKKDIFNFPLEVYGAYISFNDKLELQIDSVAFLHFKTYSRQIVAEEVIPFFLFKNLYPDIACYINPQFPKELIDMLDDYEVYWIQRIVKDIQTQNGIYLCSNWSMLCIGKQRKIHH
jgi:hypothetical protein